MTRYIQDNIPGMDEEIAKAEQSAIDSECAQLHLAHEFIRWGKYAKFSKDPEFKKRCEARRFMLTSMMGKVGGRSCR